MSKEEAAVASMGAMSATPAHYFYAASHQQAPVHHSQFSRKFLHQVSGEVPSLPRLS